MALVSRHSPGSPCWFELCTTDQAGAKEFYSRLFGWSATDYPMGPGAYYTIFQLDGADVTSACTLMPKLVEQGVPPHWGIYFATPNADESAAKVAVLGGTVVQPPFDVMDVGRMAVCQDPGEAVFALWQAKNPRGALAINQNNAVCWSELMTPDAGKAREFYTGLFGWASKGSANMASYIEFCVDGQPRGGLLPMEEDCKGIPSHWGIYIMVPDCDAAVVRAKELGGTVRFGPFDVAGVGRITALIDPHGAGFSIITLTRAAG